MSAAAPGEAVVVLGIGNEHRHDDGAGIAVARRAARAAGLTGEVEPLGEPLDLLGRWDGAALAVVVDATRSGAEPGTIHLIELTGPGKPATAPERRRGGGATSTHGLGVADVLALARALETAPRRVVLVGIEGADFSHGQGCGPQVAEALEGAAAVVAALVDEARRCA